MKILLELSSQRTLEVTAQEAKRLLAQLRELFDVPAVLSYVKWSDKAGEVPEEWHASVKATDSS